MEKWFSFLGTLPPWVLAAGLVLLLGLLGAWARHRAHSRRAKPSSAALRTLASLNNQALVPDDAPLLHQLVEEEMQLAQHLLHGLAAPPAWRAALTHELHQGRQRLLGLLGLVYAPEPVRPAAYDTFLARHPTIDFQPMTTPELPACRSIQERGHLLKKAALFTETPENVLATIVPIMREVAFAAGQEIFAKNSLGTFLFLVCSGEVGVFAGARQLASFGQGDFFGALALLDAAPRSATAVAHNPVVIFRLDQDDFYDVLAERPEVLRTIMRVLCQRLRHQNEQL